MRLLKSFTLSEILLTIGILGVVAMLTVPQLVIKKEKIQYMTYLKNFYTNFSSGMKKNMVKNGCMDLDCVGIFKDTSNSSAWNNQIDDFIRKSFIVVKSCKKGDNSCKIDGYKTLGGGSKGSYFDNLYSYETLDGMNVAIESKGCVYNGHPDKVSKLKGVCAVIYVDTNGKKLPNTLGKDMWFFVLANDGTLFPYGDGEYAKYVDGNGWKSSASYWQNTLTMCSRFSEGAVATTVGDGCGARVMEENWSINY